MRRLGGFLLIIRPVNCLMIGFSVLIGQFLAGEDIPVFPDSILGFTTAFTLAAAAMVINDYYDREIDAINEPGRPIPSGTVSPVEALAYATILEIIGLVAAALSNQKCLVITVITILVSILYNTKGKRTGLLGNFMVSSCVTMPFIYGGYLAGEDPSPLLWTFGLLAFLANTGREITKGIVDIEGDKTCNIRTIAATFGSKAAAFSASIFYLSSAMLSILPPLNRAVSALYLPLVAVTDIGLAASSISLIRKPSRENARRVKQLVLVYMLFGMLAFVAGSLPGEL